MEWEGIGQNSGPDLMRLPPFEVFTIGKNDAIIDGKALNSGELHQPACII